MSGRFTKVVENFTCAHCGTAVVGSGFTNHCPKCLHSLHVDVNPGDRAEACRGLMEPIGATQDHSEVVIVHRCSKCGQTRRIRKAENDNFEAILNLMRLGT